MVLGYDQLYYVSLCEDHHSIRLAITPDGVEEVTPQGFQERWKLIEEFNAKLLKTVKAFMPSSTAPRRYIPCSLCPKLHLKLEEARADDKPLHCVNGRLPNDYYNDLREHQGSIYTYMYWHAVHYISDVYVDVHETDGAKIAGMINNIRIANYSYICFCIDDFKVITQKGKK